MSAFVGSGGTIRSNPIAATSPRSCHGYSLYELLITLALVGILSALGAGFSQLVHSASRTAEVNTLVTYLNLARSEALKRGLPTVLCPSHDGRACDAPAGDTRWDHGLLLFVDTDGNHRPDPQDPILQRHEALQRVSIKSSRRRTHVVYHPDGFSAGTNVTFTVCDARGQAQYVIVSNSGRVRIAPLPPDGRIDEDIERCPPPAG